MKNLNLNLRLKVSDDMSNEAIADKVKALIQEKINLESKFEFDGLSIADDDSLDNINIKIIGKKISVERDAAAGYDSRLWEKATCG